MVGEDDVSAVRNEEVAIDLDARFAQTADFLQKRERVEHDTVANNAAAAGAQHATRNKLQHKFLAIDNDGVAGIVASGIAGYDGKVLREHVDNFAFALIAPLGANDDRGLAFFHDQLRPQKSGQADGCAALGVAHSSPAGIPG